MNALHSATRVLFLLLLLPCVLFSPHGYAHDSRPAYLQITELPGGEYAMLWRTPVKSGRRLPVALGLPETTITVGEPVVQRLHDSLLEHRRFRLPEGIAGQRIDFTGLQATITDVLVRIEYADGRRATQLVQPSQAWLDVPEPQSGLTVATSYLRHGVDHILFGFDHLLFVLALLLIVRNLRVLLWTVTAFTLAHSITLALSTLGVVRLPSTPVEAVIALSIVLLASEILRVRRGHESATARWPWLVAFAFGLLHGFGFAGALSELGLPEGDIPLALLAFNLGVELGQLLFITAVLTVIALARRMNIPTLTQRYAMIATTYGIGCLAMFWFCERAAQLI
ncbi:HupE/UreJ family protein [Microbulbifer pacificus]|uniref:HupE/UreJ family protein n=1 Tax=Microbulbifer pacificus TaxID=407164 RepID=UPI0018F8883F|nr:HupE/UreJ family protein [Microbulbifer pacificus]